MPAGELIRQSREHARLSQAQVATACGVTAGAVSQWEHGLSTPLRKNAIVLDDIFQTGGTITEALGYAPDVDGDLRRRVAALEGIVVDLKKRVDAMFKRLERLLPPAD